MHDKPQIYVCNSWHLFVADLCLYIGNVTNMYLVTSFCLNSASKKFCSCSVQLQLKFELENVSCLLPMAILARFQCPRGLPKRQLLLNRQLVRSMRQYVSLLYASVKHHKVEECLKYIANQKKMIYSISNPSQGNFLFKSSLLFVCKKMLFTSSRVHLGKSKIPPHHVHLSHISSIISFQLMEY